MVKSFDDLLAHWTAAELRDDLGIGYDTAASMKRRGSVSPGHWPALLEAASRKDIPLDAEMLTKFWVGLRKAAGTPERAA